MDLNHLKAALQPLSNFGKQEISFTINQAEVTLRPLLPKEEIECQKYSASILAESVEEESLGENDPLTRSAALRYFDQFRIEVIAYAIAQIGNTDLRGVTFIETGETLDNGTSVRIPKHEALRKIITESWSRGAITIAFSRYGDLMSEIAEEADEIAKESVSDLEAEVQRLEARLSSLKEERENRAKGDPSVTAQQIKTLISAGKAIEDDVQAAVEAAQELKTSREIEREMQEVDEILDEVEGEEAPILNEPLPSPPPPRKPVTPQASPPPTKPADGFVSSFADPEETEAAFEPDERRIREARAAAAARARQQAESDRLAAAKQEGTVRRGDKDVPVYRLPSEELSSREEHGKPPPQEGGKIDPTLNPNFRRPGKK